MGREYSEYDGQNAAITFNCIPLVKCWGFGE